MRPYSLCRCSAQHYGGHCQMTRYPGEGSSPATTPAAAGKGNGILEEGDMRLTVMIAAPLAVIALATCGVLGYMVGEFCPQMRHTLYP